MIILVDVTGKLTPLWHRMQVDTLKHEQAQAQSQAESSLHTQHSLAGELACQRTQASQLASTFEAALASASQDHAAHVQVRPSISCCQLSNETQLTHQMLVA